MSRRARIALHEFYHAITGACAAQLLEPSLLKRISFQIMATDDENGECALLESGGPDLSPAAEKAAKLSAAGPLLFLEVNDLRALVRHPKKIFLGNPELSEQDTRILQSLDGHVDPTLLSRTLCAAFAYNKSLGDLRQEAIKVLLKTDPSSGFEIPAEALNSARIKSACAKADLLFAAARRNNSWSTIA